MADAETPFSVIQAIETQAVQAANDFAARAPLDCLAIQINDTSIHQFNASASIEIAPGHTVEILPNPPGEGGTIIIDSELEIPITSEESTLLGVYDDQDEEVATMLITGS